MIIQKYLTIQKGLPQSQVFTICFDSNDYTWIGTQGGGVAVYNGDEYKYLTKQDKLLLQSLGSLKKKLRMVWT